MTHGKRLPDFIIVGAQKCGTTTLHYALGKHPRVFTSNPKELNFFEDDDNYARGIDWYASFFERSPSYSTAGEASPEYFHYECVPRRIAETLPDAKIIVLLRNPVDRAYSGYWHSVREAGERLTFEEAIEIEGQRILESPFNMKFYSYVHRGDYFRQLKPYFDLMGRSRVLVMISEEYFANPRPHLKQVTDFLDVGCDNEFLDKVHGVVRNEGRSMRSAKVQRLYPHLRTRIRLLARVLYRMNKRKQGYPPMAQSTRLRLLERFDESIVRLEELLNRDLSPWRDMSHTAKSL